MKLLKSTLASSAILAALIGCSSSTDSTDEPVASSTVVSSVAASSAEVASSSSVEVIVDENAQVAGSAMGSGSYAWATGWTKAGTIEAGSPGYVIDESLAATETLSGDITADMTLDASKVYQISGYVNVKSGATLTIPAGTLIKSTGKSALIVERGAKLMAEGTADAPIVFTSGEAAPKKGDWAGIVIAGKAPISHADGEIDFEGNEAGVLDIKFGGDDAADNSGTLKYVVIEYAGYVVGTDAELNGLTLGAVGNGTTISYVQVHEGQDDAFEWFGGTVNVDHLVATSQGDDGFDIDYGYNGNGETLLQINDGGDKSIEAGSKAKDAQNLTAPNWNDITLIGDGNTAMALKDNVSGTYTGVTFAGSFEEEVSASGTVTEAMIAAETTVITRVDGTSAFGAAAVVSVTGTTGSGTYPWATGWTTPGSVETGSAGYVVDAAAVATETITGDISADMTLDASKVYAFSGYVTVKEGATLTIPAGTLIKSTGKSALIVERGAKLMAEGTAQAPILFTSGEASPKKGDWAGIVIAGKAPISHADGEIDFEGNEAGVLELKFGGDDAADNSGSLKYVVIEYAGYVVGTDAELNGLTLGAVGTGTTISYVQVHEGQDDAFEWFGGTVGVDHIVATAQGDDGFDIDYGYNGTGDHLLQVNNGGDKSIEAGSKAKDAQNLTAPTWDNITLVGDGNTAMALKDNVSGTYTNVTFAGTFTEKVSASGTVTEAMITAGTTVVTDETGTSVLP